MKNEKLIKKHLGENAPEWIENSCEDILSEFKETLMHPISDLLETYQRRLENITNLLKRNNRIIEHRRLDGKEEVIKLIIIELKGLLN